jgi:nicotinamide-nucleotide amidase
MDQELHELSLRTGEALADAGYMLVTAESCTGGGIGAAVTMVAGSSRWYEGGFVTYSNAAKQALLGVPPETLLRHGAVSEATVTAMVDGALLRAQAGMAVAVSGVAGPGGGTLTKPVGMVCIAWGRADGFREARTYRFPGDREAVRRQTVIEALTGVIRLSEGGVAA